MVIEAGFSAESGGRGRSEVVASGGRRRAASVGRRARSVVGCSGGRAASVSLGRASGGRRSVVGRSCFGRRAAVGRSSVVGRKEKKSSGNFLKN